MERFQGAVRQENAIGFTGSVSKDGKAATITFNNAETLPFNVPFAI